jgi:hypothetical protein
MSVVLSSPFEVQPWTDEAIKTILKNKKVPGVKDRLKEFASNFLKNNYSDQIGGENSKISEDLLASLREISSPYNYFA